MSNLAKSAMLVSVTIVNGGLLGERKDTTATAQMERRFDLHERRGKASKFLIDRRHPKVKAVVAASQRVREVLYKYTMPWGDDKSRLLPVGVHDDFKRKMADAEAELREAWDEYIQVYPALIASSERELGKLFDRSEYPSTGQARDMFTFKVTYWPLPVAGHFIAEVSEEAAKDATMAMSLEIETRLKEAAQSLVDRAKEHAQILLERLNSFKSKKDGKIIRDSLVNNCTEIGGMLMAMNITENKDIHALANDMRRLGYLTAESLRENTPVREGAKKMAKAILDKVIDLNRLDLEVADMVAEAAEYEF
jgi:hypothetical protein